MFKTNVRYRVRIRPFLYFILSAAHINTTTISLETSDKLVHCNEGSRTDPHKCQTNANIRLNYSTFERLCEINGSCYLGIIVFQNDFLTVNIWGGGLGKSG